MGLVHFNWTELIPNVLPSGGDGINYVHVATAVGVLGLSFLIGIVARGALGSGPEAIKPAGRFSVKGFFELLIEFIVSLSDMVLGEKGRHFTPLFAFIFFFILLNNLVGLLPGMTPATDNINTTVAFGVFSFIAYNLYGFKEHGPGYLKHFLGPVLALGPLMLIVEIISHGVRPLSLGIRLQGNMSGDHTVLGIFLDLVPYGVPVIFYGLGTFVCMMQAFVFTILTMIYVSMAISHDH